VENCFDGLLQAQKQLEENGSISGRIHRFFIAAGKAACSI